MKRIYLFLLAIIVLSACSKKNTVKVIDTNITDEVEVNSSLSFTFSKSVVPDSIVGQWVEADLLELSPEVEGTYKWTSTDKLVFIPKRNFNPSTNYTCKITKKVLMFKKELSLSGDLEYEFHTPLLELLSTRAFWDLSEETGSIPVLKLSLQFNQKVDPQEVVKLLTINIDKVSKQYTTETTSPSDEILFVIADIKAEDKDLKTEVQLGKGLISVGGSVKTEDDINEKINIPSPFKLNIVDVQTGHDGSFGTITVYTTQAVKEKDFKTFVSISPKVNYTFEIFPNYFLIKSEQFSMEKEYEIIIKKGLAGKIGGEIKHDYSQALSFGEVEPAISFNDQKEFYVSGKGSKNIEVSIINVPNVTIKVTKIYENNVLSYLRTNSNTYYDEYDEYYYEDYYSSGVNVEDIGDVVYEKEVQTNTLLTNGINKVLTLDFEDKLAEYPGVYLIEVKAVDNYWLNASKLIAISDIGLIIKEGKNNITVFANSIKTTEALANVEIGFIGNNNQLTYTAKTDANGILIFNHEKFKTPGFTTKLVTARLGNDYNIVPFNKTHINTSRFDVGGMYQNPSGMQAFIYGERNLYRPGETMNISAIIRDYNWKSPGSIPVKVLITTPNGISLKKLKKVLNAHGSFETSVELSPIAATGSYVVDVYTTNDVIIGSTVIKVEEFMPDRIKVNLELDKNEYSQGEAVDVSAEAVNFFGPPAANRNYEVQLSTSRLGFYSKEHPEFNYYIQGAESYFSNIYRDGTTDGEGKVFESFDIPQEWENMGVLRSNIFLTVFDETGRPVNRLKSFKIYTQKVFFGIKNDQYYAKTGQPARFDFIAVDKNGKALSAVKAKMQLIRHEYKTVMSRSGDYFRYRSEKIETILEEKTISINETASAFSFVPDISGTYELRLSAPETNTYVSQYLYAYGWGNTRYSSFKVNKEGQIDIQLDKEKYNVGDKAKVLLKAPFQGKVLVTIETDKVVDHFYIETDKRAASFEIDIKDEYVPNVYITATLFKPHGVSDLPLTVAHGIAPVLIDNPANKIPLTIKAVEKSRSNSKQIIKIKSAPNSAVTIATVDEGILQVGGFSTPDPYAFFYQKRALEVNSYDIYPYLFPELGAIRSSTGGGAGEMGMDKRLNPLKNNRVKLVSFWSGILLTNSRGEAEYEINIPEFSGNLRIMAVAYNNGKVFGSAKANMTIADPIVQSVALPRFLSPGDKIVVPVILTNTTQATAKCKSSIAVSGPLSITSEKTKTISIPSNSEGELSFTIDANLVIGQSSVTITTSALNEKFISKTEMPVRPSSPLQKRNSSGSVQAGKEQSIDINIDEFMGKSADFKLVVSNNPLVQFTNSLDYLVGYPHGCIEQTVSKAFPQIYFSDLLGTVFTAKRAAADAGSNVQTALNKLKLMQLYSGGLTYWPGGGSETWWGSVYAAHFALEAKKAGYDVDEDFLERLLKYLKTRLREKNLITYYFNFNQRKEIAPKEVAYSLYVLTLAGEKPTALLNYYKANASQLSLDSKYLLAGAYALSGDTKKYKEVVPEAFEGERSVKTFGGSFNSYIRDEAIALNVLLEVDPENSQIGIMAQHISKELMNSRYLNTQERTFGFLAIGKIARKAAKSNITGQVKGNGKSLAQFNNNTITLTTEQLKGEKLSIEAQGTGSVYYFWESEGISKNGTYIEEDSYIAVRKAFFDRNGNRINSNTFKQNDLVLVEISIMALKDEFIENVAISDILPAGFEIENPRITTLPPGMSYPNSRNSPDYIDVRDDRINLYVDVSTYKKYYYYMVRCVSPGTFKMGPVGADAMYNGEYHSYSGGGEVVINK
jgi:alpha-2-macroglobulin